MSFASVLNIQSHNSVLPVVKSSIFPNIAHVVKVLKKTSVFIYFISEHVFRYSKNSEANTSEFLKKLDLSATATLI